MRKIYPFILISILSIVVVVGIVSSQEKKGPRILIAEPNFDFGFAPEGTFMVHEYTIKNVGDEPLEIKRVRTTCGCTSAPVKKMRLEPNEETTITVIFNSTRYFHKTSKAAIISTNDPTRPSEKVTFIANMDTVKPRSITPVPRKIDLGRGNNFKKNAKVTIRNISDEPLTLQVIDYYKEYLNEPQLSAVDLPVGGTVDASVSVREDIPEGEIIRSSFTIAAMDKDGKEVTRITVPVVGGGK